MTDLAGNVVEQYKYDPYGQVSIFGPSRTPRLSSDANNPYLFTGRRYDQETGLYRYRNRGYHPELGRFLQRDPLGYIDGLNAYTYVKNNPFYWSDPFGLQDHGPKNRAKGKRQRDRHDNRNQKNYAPRHEPKYNPEDGNYYDACGNRWIRDEIGSRCYHGGYAPPNCFTYKNNVFECIKNSGGGGAGADCAKCGSCFRKAPERILGTILCQKACTSCANSVGSLLSTYIFSSCNFGYESSCGECILP